MPVKYRKEPPEQGPIKKNPKKITTKIIPPETVLSMWLQLSVWIAVLGGRTPGVRDEECNVEEAYCLQGNNSVLGLFET